MAETKKLVGRIRCIACGCEIPVKESDKGAVSVSCGFCDLSAYAKHGTEAKRLIMGALIPGSAPAVVKEIEKETPAAEEPKQQAPAQSGKKSGLLFAR